MLETKAPLALYLTWETVHITMSAPHGVTATFGTLGSGPFRGHMTTSRIAELDSSGQWPPCPVLDPALCLLGVVSGVGAVNTGRPVSPGGSHDFDFFVVFLWSWNPGPSMKQAPSYQLAPYLGSLVLKGSSEGQLGRRALSREHLGLHSAQQQKRNRKCLQKKTVSVPAV